MTRAEIIKTMARAMCDPISADRPIPYRLLNDGTKIRSVDDHDYQAGTTPYWEWFHGHQATAALSALESAGLAVVPRHAMASGHMEESAGKALYEHFAFYPNEQKPAWTPAGNAIRQDDARRLAMAAVNAWLAAAQGAQKP